MNIAFLINNLSHGAGTERVTCEIANGLSDRGNSVYIISCRQGQNAVFTLSKNVSVISLEGENIKNALFRKIVLKKRLSVLTAEYKLEVLIAVDVILYYYLLGFKMCHPRLKLIAWEHFNYYAKRSGARKLARWLSCRYSDAVVVLGQQDLKNYTSHFKKINRIVCIYNPVSVSQEPKSQLKNKVVLAVGRLNQQKGFDLLLQAWNMIEPDFTDWELLIIGDGEEEDTLKTLIQTYELKNVSIIPFQENIEEWYLDASIFALSSRYEGFVLVMIEAMMKGLPVISFDCREGPAELIEDGVNGYLVEVGDLKAYSDKLKILMKNEALRKKFAHESQNKLFKFDKNHVLDEWEKLIGAL